jgi:hypothetical protein
MHHGVNPFERPLASFVVANVIPQDPNTGLLEIPRDELLPVYEAIKGYNATTRGKQIQAKRSTYVAGASRDEHSVGHVRPCIVSPDHAQPRRQYAAVTRKPSGNLISS